MQEIILRLESELLEIFEYLHANPELSWEEHNTTRFLAEQLEHAGYRVTTFADCTGVIGELGEGTPTVALRVDIDALWQEVNGIGQAVHSCGHDAHAAMGVGVVKFLNMINYKPPGKLKFIFQPAEEAGTGALKLLRKRVIDDVDYLYGVHLRPVQELPNGSATPAILHSASRFVLGEIRGLASHGARPHLGINVIEAGSLLVQELSKIHRDPQIPSSVKMTRFRAGGQNTNIIPDFADFAIDIRAENNEVLENIYQRIKKIAAGVENIYGAEVRLQIESGTAAAVLNENAASIMAQAISKVLGEQNCRPPVRSPGGEDFHFYSLYKPTLNATMLGLGCNLAPGLHHPEMSFDRRYLLNGVQILATAIMESFNQVRKEQ